MNGEQGFWSLVYVLSTCMAPLQMCLCGASCNAERSFAPVVILTDKAVVRIGQRGPKPAVSQTHRRGASGWPGGFRRPGANPEALGAGRMDMSGLRGPQGTEQKGTEIERRPHVAITSSPRPSQRPSREALQACLAWNSGMPCMPCASVGCSSARSAHIFCLLSLASTSGSC